jgi:hypothetical protein
MNYTLPKNASSVFTVSLIDKFSKDQSSLSQQKVQITYGKSIIDLNHLDSLRFLYEYFPKNFSERLIRKMLIKNMSDAESACRGSAFISNVAFLKALKSKSSLEEATVCLKEFSKNSRRGDLNSLNCFLESFVKNKHMLRVANKIITEGGFSASCNIDSTYSFTDYTSLIKSSSFKVRVDPNFSLLTKQKEFSKSNCNLIIADGVIESVSEIHHILEHFSSNKEFCFIVCRGYANDVISTLAKNFLKKSLNVIPGLLITDIESINSLKDISVISASDMISTLKGDNFSSFDLSAMQKIESIKLNENRLEINNLSQHKNVMNLVKNLRKQIEDEFHPDKIDLLEKRISFLNPRRLDIFFSNHEKDTVGIKKDQMKSIISLINSYCVSGAIHFNKTTGNKLIDEIIEEIKKTGTNSFPAGAFFEGVNVGIKNASMIKNTEQVILNDS